MICPKSHKHGATTNCYFDHRCRCSACILAAYDTRTTYFQCDRCGISLHSGRRTEGLCRDCRGVLTSEERLAWAS